MKERTEIDRSNLHFTYMELAICNVYDVARTLLNELLAKEIGREYGDDYDFDEESDKWICKEIKYKNSNDPKVVKRAVVDALTIYLKERERISEEGTIVWEKSKVIDTAIMPFKRMDDELDKVCNWVQYWKKEQAPTAEEKRLRPIKGKEQYVDIMFERLIKYGYFDKDESKETWCYLCGTNDNKPDKLLYWKGDTFAFCVLYDKFLASADNKYFEFKNGLQPFIVSLFGYTNVASFKSRLSSYKSNKEKREEMSEIWNKMKDPQMT